MNQKNPTRDRVEELEDLVRALQADEVDALVVLEQHGVRLSRIHKDEPMYRTIVDKLPQCIASVLADGTIVYANNHLTKSIGPLTEKLLGSSLLDAVAENDRARFAAMLQLALESPREETFTLRWSDGDGQALVSASCFSIYGADTIGLVIMDVRDQVARQAAEESSRAKDELLASVSHELRIPLTAIMGWIQLMELDASGDESIRSALQQMKSAVLAQTRIVDDLLDLAHSERGAIALDAQEFDLCRVMRTAASFVRLQAQNKGVALTTEIPGDALVVRGDPNRLQQVFVNLLSNAVKFTAEGEVAIRARREDGWAVVEVSDTGMGIGEDFVPYVFEPFRRGTRAKGYPGIGIGLAISRRLIEAHGGTIEAASEGTNRGATFTVRLRLL